MTLPVAKAPSRSLTVKVTGLPKRTKAAVTIKRKGYKKLLKRSKTLKRMKPGTYRIVARTVRVGGSSYVPSPKKQRVRVTSGKGKRVRIRYRPVSPPTPPIPPPVAPVSEFRVGDRELTSVSMAWAASQDSVVVRRAAGPTALDSLNAGVPVAVTQESARDTGLAPGTEYSYAAFAIASDGRVSAPSVLTVKTLSISSISAGGDHTCSLIDDGSIRCWGENSFGQLGNGSFTPTDVSTVVGVSDAIAVSAGRLHSCAIRSDRSVVCWGYGNNGELGNNDTISSGTPVPVALGLDKAFTLSSGDGFSCASLLGGRVKCWGLGVAGQMGDGAANAINKVPVQVTGVTTALSVSAGSGSACASLVDGTGRCWGFNGSGQLGVSFPPSNQLSPVQVVGLADSQVIGIGNSHACARSIGAGTVQCWGRNDAGQLGDGTFTGSSNPVNTSVSAVTSLSVGGFSSCVTVEGGTVKCWGANSSGQIGDGTFTDVNSPVQVAGLGDASSVSTGYQHVCATRVHQLPVCWGAGDGGQLGDRGTSDRATPVPVAVLR
jgi:alpha-tubulin suppressor-like RCC1 family protein